MTSWGYKCVEISLTHENNSQLNLLHPLQRGLLLVILSSLAAKYIESKLFFLGVVSRAKRPTNTCQLLGFPDSGTAGFKPRRPISRCKGGLLDNCSPRTEGSILVLHGKRLARGDGFVHLPTASPAQWGRKRH